MSQVIRPLLHLLVWSTLTEFLFLRVFLRLGPILPSDEALGPLYRLVETVGVTALNLSVLASIALLVAAIVEVRRQPGDGVLAGILAVAVGVNLGVLLMPTPVPWWTVGHTLVMMIAILAVAVRLRHLERGRLTLGLMVAAQILALSYVLLQRLTGAGIDAAVGTLSLVAAEAVAVAAAIALPWSARARLSWRQIAIGAVVGGLFLVVDSARPWTVATMAMWTVTFTLSLPSLVYAIGLGVFIASLLALRREPATVRLAIGVLLVALAGLKPDFSYVSLLWLTGLVIAGGLLPKPAESAQSLEAHPIRTIEAVGR